MWLAAACLLVSASPAAPLTTREVTVDATSSEWKTVGTIPKGGHAKVSVLGGDATCHIGGASDCPIGDPAGSGKLCSASGPNGDQNNPPGPAGEKVPYGGLAGQVVPKSGTPKPFPIRDAKTIHKAGKLQLVFNDCAAPAGYSDNAGSFQVAVALPEHLVQLSGRVTEHDWWVEENGNPSEFPIEQFVVVGSPNQTVEVAGQAGAFFATTGNDGRWDLDVPEGRYRVSVAPPADYPPTSTQDNPGPDHEAGPDDPYAEPESRDVDADGDVSSLDFNVCPVHSYGSDTEGYIIWGNAPCGPLVRVDAAVLDVDDDQYGAEAGIVGGGDLQTTNKKGEAVLRVPNGSLLVAGDSGLVHTTSKPVRVKAKHGRDSVRFTLEPAIEFALQNPDGTLKLLVGGLPHRKAGFSLEIERDQATAGSFCTFQNRITFDLPSAGQVFPSGLPRHHSAELDVAPKDIGPWCEGGYAATVTSDGRKLASIGFSIGS
jgi:hypothetical protein